VLPVSVAHAGREIELRRHTDADGDVLTAEGVAAALEIGARLRGGYHLAVSTGAQRATQALASFLAALGEQVPGGVVVEAGLRSQVEDRWRAAYQKAETARSGLCARPIPSSSRGTRSGSAPPFAASSTACPKTAAPSSSATARRMRPRSSASPARSWRRSRKERASASATGDDGFQVEPFE
jgi:hypothetical protein